MQCYDPYDQYRLAVLQELVILTPHTYGPYSACHIEAVNLEFSPICPYHHNATSLSLELSLPSVINKYGGLRKSHLSVS